jgi:hypothetical protein
MIAGVLLMPCGAPVAVAQTTGPATPLHYTVNLQKDYSRAAAVGFNLADVSSRAALDALPETMKGVYWVGNGYKRECRWDVSDDDLRAIVAEVKDHPKFSGIYRIADTPHPAVCPDAPTRLAERTALIHSLDPNGKTFVVVVDGWNHPGEFEQLRDAADYIGVNPYPCNMKNLATGCDWDKVRERVNAAIDAGIEVHRIVPVFQAFGQTCTTAERQYYRLPTVAETKALLALWDELVPVHQRPFDMTYSWGSQPRHSCPSLGMADGISYENIQGVFWQYFAETRR